ncbi:hypothetical protein PUN28_019290 [Cardiocondyla obscurior]|uniref:Uncharacterized protein n=1 Tax=Cardiocondyla obscurior TaxID=286306 RepID=A0AAW2EC42_9HYME
MRTSNRRRKSAGEKRPNAIVWREAIFNKTKLNPFCVLIFYNATNNKRVSPIYREKETCSKEKRQKYRSVQDAVSIYALLNESTFVSASARANTCCKCTVTRINVKRNHCVLKKLCLQLPVFIISIFALFENKVQIFCDIDSLKFIAI